MKRDLDKKKPQEVATGHSGVPIHSGYISPDVYDSWCSPREWPRFAEEMYNRDDDIMAGWSALQNTLTSATFKWKPGDPEDPVSVELATRMNENFGFNGQSGRLKRTFEQILKQILLYIPVGFRYMEVIWRKTVDGFYDVYDIADRKPSAHEKWITYPVDKDGNPIDEEWDGSLYGVTQEHPYGDLLWHGQDISFQPFINGKDLLLFVNNQEGDNYNGVGLLRAVERIYNRKVQADLKLNHFFRGRSIWPIKIKKEELENDDPCGIYDFNDKLNVTVQSLIKHQLGQQATIVLYPGMELQNQMTTEHHPRETMEIFTHCSEQILTVFLVQFLKLGLSDTGSRALVSGQESFFRRAAKNYLDYVCGVFNGERVAGRGLAGEYAYWNAPVPNLPSEKLPYLCHEGLELDSRLEKIELAMQAAEKGLMGPLSTADYNHFRDCFSLPPIQETEIASDDALEGARRSNSEED